MNHGASVVMGACLGAMAIMFILSSSVAAVYRDRGLMIHAATSLLGVIACALLAGGYSLELRTIVLLVFAAVALQLHALLAHVSGLHGKRQGLLWLGLALAGMAPLPWLLGGIPFMIGLVVWLAVMMHVLRAGWPQCLPWMRTASMGYTLLTVAGVLLATDTMAPNRAPLVVATLLALWSCLLYMAIVWRHRILGDQQLTRARDQFLAVLGHDLRTPLQTIAISAHILEHGADAAAVGQRILRSSARMERLITDILDLSRLQNGIGLGIRLRDVDLCDVLRAAAQDVRTTAKDLEVALDCPATLKIQGDIDRLSQLLDNLLSNAVHHGDPGAPITLRLQCERHGVRLEVRNRAQPIPPIAVPQLFSPYKSQSVGNERNRTGLGLGLYIAHEIARAHNGTLEYEWCAPEVVFALTLRCQVQ